MSKASRAQIQQLIMEEPKKELKWRRLPNGLYSLFYEGGGELPDVLKGNYTSVFACTKAIDEYTKGK